MTNERLFDSAESVGDKLFKKALEYRGLPYDGEKDIIGKDNTPMMRRVAKVAQYDLSKSEDMETYASVLQDIADGKALLSFEERIYDPDIKSWRVLIRWAELRYTTHKKKKGAKNE